MPRVVGRRPLRKSLQQRLSDYVVENPLKSLTAAALTFGGLFLLIFFVRIGFMPDVDLQSVTSVLYAVAILGLFLLVIFAFTVVAPGIAHRVMLRKMEPEEVNSNHPIILPPAFAGLVWAVYFVSILFADEGPGQQKVLLLLMLVASFGVISGGCFLLFGARSAPSVKRRWWYFGVTSAIFLLMSVPVVFVFSSGLTGNWGVADKLLVGIEFSLSLALISVLAMVVASPELAPATKQVVFVAGVGLMAVFSLTGNLSFIPNSAISMLRLGNISKTSVAITASACRKVNSALGWVACSLPADERSPIQLCPVEIQSRIGSQYLLSLTYPMKSAFSKSEAASSPRYQLILEKADVLAWSPGRNFCDSSQPSDPAASAVAGQQSEAPNPQTAASTPSAPIAANAASGPPPSSVASFKGAVTQPQVTSGSATNVAVSISGTLTIQAPHAIHKPPANSAVHRPVRCVQPSPCCGSVERCEGVVGSGPVSQNTRAASEPL